MPSQVTDCLDPAIHLATPPAAHLTTHSPLLLDGWMSAVKLTLKRFKHLCLIITPKYLNYEEQLLTLKHPLVNWKLGNLLDIAHFFVNIQFITREVTKGVYNSQNFRQRNSQV